MQRGLGVKNLTVNFTQMSTSHQKEGYRPAVAVQIRAGKAEEEDPAHLSHWGRKGEEKEKKSKMARK